jgi:hypothetical protein
MTVVRYTAHANVSATHNTVPALGNSVGTMAKDGLTSAKAPAAFNPANLLLSETFDVEIYDRRDGTGTDDGVSQSFIKIRDARFERRSGGLNAKGLLEEQFTFNGILLDDDLISVSESGLVQA